MAVTYGGSKRHHHVDLAATAHDIGSDLLARSGQHHVDGAVAEPEVADPDLLDACWKPRLIEPDDVALEVEGKSESGLHQRKWGRARPSLW